VIVPVLSKTTRSIRAAFSKASLLFIKIPLLAAKPKPIITAVGVARPKVQGQVIIKTETKIVKAKGKLAPWTSQRAKARTASAKTLGTMKRATRSANS